MCAEGSVAESRGGVRPVDWVTESSVGNTASGNPKESIVLIDEGWRVNTILNLLFLTTKGNVLLVVPF